MKNILIILFFANLTCTLLAQNLVPNPSFEDKYFCPDRLHTLYCVEWDSIVTPPVCIRTSAESSYFDSAVFAWKSYRETPNYFHSCATSQTVDMPSNVFGYQAAIDGDAYIGITTFNLFSINAIIFREVVGCQLLIPLIIGTKYYVSAFVCRAVNNNNNGYSGAANNNLGFRFSTVPYFQHDSIPVDNFAQYHDTTIITDSINWTRIFGSFIADSNYSYLAIGNFFDEQSTQAIDINQVGLNYQKAYYYIDQVCVSTDSLTCKLVTGNEEINKSRVNLYPNPVSGLLKAEVDDEKEVTIIIYDMQLKKVLQQSFFKSAYMNTENLEPGIYFYKLTGKEGMIKTGKLVMMEK